MIELRPYQLAFIASLRAAFQAGHQRVLGVSPTGSGKSACAAHMVVGAQQRGSRCLLAAGRTELIDQLAAALRAAGADDLRIIQAERDEGRADAPVIVGSIQTLTQPRWLGQLPPVQFGVLDEAHHGVSSTWADVVRSHPDARWVGLTASPQRSDGRALDLFTALVAGPSVAELVALEHLVPCRLWAPPTALATKQLALDPVTAYLQHGHGELATVFCGSVSHATETAAAFAAAGVPAQHIDGRMSARRRAGVLAALAAGEIRVMPSVDVVTEGFDLPALSVAIIARRVGHVGRWIQMLGRVLRPAPGKTLARVIDLCGSAHEHGPPDLPREYSLDGSGITPLIRTAFRQCSGCGAMFVAAAACPHCGAVIPLAEQQGPRVTGVGVTLLTPSVSRAQPREYPKLTIAKRSSPCSACGGIIQVGSEYVWLTLAKRARHRVCPAQQQIGQQP
jgi:superfamily II DNA or RNA helicase